MMSTTDILLVAVALAMDCFTVSMVGGIIVRRWLWGVVVRMALLFGLFQALMPLAGWAATARFSSYIEQVDHWVAFALLAFIGGKMVKEGLERHDTPSLNPTRLRTQLLLAVATSIDALAIGISMACLGYRHVAQLAMPLLAIGAASTLLSIAGYLLGMRFGRGITRRLNPELAGGIVLIAIGIKVLVTHLSQP